MFAVMGKHSAAAALLFLAHFFAYKQSPRAASRLAPHPFRFAGLRSPRRSLQVYRRAWKIKRAKLECQRRRVSSGGRSAGFLAGRAVWLTIRVNGRENLMARKNYFHGADGQGFSIRLDLETIERVRVLVGIDLPKTSIADFGRLMMEPEKIIELLQAAAMPRNQKLTFDRPTLARAIEALAASIDDKYAVGLLAIVIKCRPDDLAPNTTALDQLTPADRYFI
jgi:hypothetical protein